MTITEAQLNATTAYLNKRVEEVGVDQTDQETGVDNFAEVAEWFIDQLGDTVLGATAYSGFTLGMAIGSGRIQHIEVGSDEEFEAAAQALEEQGFTRAGDIDDSPDNTVND